MSEMAEIQNKILIEKDKIITNLKEQVELHKMIGENNQKIIAYLKCEVSRLQKLCNEFVAAEEQHLKMLRRR